MNVCGDFALPGQPGYTTEGAPVVVTPANSQLVAGYTPFPVIGLVLGAMGLLYFGFRKKK